MLNASLDSLVVVTTSAEESEVMKIYALFVYGFRSWSQNVLAQFDVIVFIGRFWKYYDRKLQQARKAIARGRCNSEKTNKTKQQDRWQYHFE